MKKVMLVFGTRPEAVKMAPLVHAIRACPDLQGICCVTGQHREMLDDVLRNFQVCPDYDLDIMEKNQTLFTVTSKTLDGMKNVLEKEKPDIVLVHGDTSTSFAAALAAFYQQIPVGHVEAGLRTFDKYSPFPEEMNRTLTGDIATLHFSPTVSNKQNLLKEAVSGEIFITGNTVIDALQLSVKDNYEFRTPVLNTLDFTKRIVLVTAHRRENYGEPMENIMHALKEIVESYEDIQVVYPVHLNPIVREVVWRILGDVERVVLCDPLATDEMHNLINRSYMLMTDSGGLQEEAPSLGVPVLVLRKETERPEAVEANTVKVVGVEKENIVAEAKLLLDNEEEYKKMAHAVNPYGDGKACERIIDAIKWYFGMKEDRPEDY